MSTPEPFAARDAGTAAASAAGFTASAPAKLNFGLHVLRLRTDGYRDIDTVFVRIPWCDVVTVRPADDLSMTCSDPSLPVDGRNLCMRAAELLAGALRSGAGAAIAAGHGARIHLDKRVPYGAGLGSGSSDAATTLRLLCRLWGVDPGADTLADIALSLGSDVPYFLGPPIARGTGSGENLTPIEAPALAGMHLVVAVPPVHIATGAAYAMVEPRESDRPDLAALVASGDTNRWRRELRNDFQEPVARAYAQVADALTLLKQAGAQFASLSGSGSSVFGVFASADDAGSAAATLRGEGNIVWTGLPGDPA